MNDLINRQMAIDAVLSIGHTAKLTNGDAVVRMSAVNYVLRNLPSVEPKHGKWHVKESFVVLDVCDQCTRSVRHVDPFYDFCPHCGADMRQRKEEPNE